MTKGYKTRPLRATNPRTFQNNTTESSKQASGFKSPLIHKFVLHYNTLYFRLSFAYKWWSSGWMGSGTLTVRLKAIMPFWTNYSEAISMKRIINHQSGLFVELRNTVHWLQNYSVYEKLGDLAKPLYSDLEDYAVHTHTHREKTCFFSTPPSNQL